MRWARLVGVGVAVWMAGAARAHEFWIKPATFRPAVQTPVRVELRVGDAIPGEGVMRDESKIISFAAAGPGASGEARPIAGLDGKEPAGIARFVEAGVYVLGYRSGPSGVELPAEKFESYLREDGLEKIIARRAERGESGRPGREMFSRCAKAVVGAGGTVGEGFDRVLGMRLEIVPERDPLGMRSGEALPCRVIFEGAPARGVLVRAMGEGGERVSARTDEQGRASLRLDAPGLWVVSGVEMVEAPAGLGVEWESLWASLSLEVGG
jgi:Domain of unknown function (DUF4198)